MTRTQDQENQQREFDKSVAAMRHWLLGRISAARYELNIPTPWSLALDSFEYALSIHVGRRKDGSPEMIHQIHIAHYLRTMESHLVDAPLTIACAMLHDAREDYDISHEEIEKKFGYTIAHKIEILTKVYRGVKKSDAEYYRLLASDPICSIVKATDRFHNHSTMGNAFSITKQLSYLLETEQLVLPMIKIAQRAFPMQEAAFENIKLSLKSQISLVRPALETAQKLSQAQQLNAEEKPFLVKP